MTNEKKHWKAKAILPLANDFEKELLAAMEQQAEDNHFAKIKNMHGLQLWHRTNAYRMASDKGYFSAVITGPGGYFADAILHSPYNVPLMVLEYDVDLLQKEVVEYPQVEESFEANLEGGSNGTV